MTPNLDRVAPYELDTRDLAALARAPYVPLDPLEVRHQVPAGLMRRYRYGEITAREFWREVDRLLGSAALSDEQYFEGRTS